MVRIVARVQREEIDGVTGAGDARGVLDPATVLIAAAAASAGLSAVSLWWALPTAVASFLAGRRPGRARPALTALASVITAGVVAVSVVPGWLLLGSRFVAVLVAGMLAWFAGRFWCQYQELVRAGWERAEQLEREQRLVAGEARLRERARIAQDMHDVLGHDLSLIALSAGALKLAPGLEERHRDAAGDIRIRAAAAVERLGEVIGVLSEESDDTARAADFSIPRLVTEASLSGLAVEPRLDPVPDGVPPVVERAAHRVVQEALTNVAKHAPGATTTVCVTHTAGETAVVVANGPPPTSVPTGPRRGGRGLIGLDERVRLAGGSLDHGPRGGGFAVVARLPHTSPVQPPPVMSVPKPAGGELPREHRRAQRRLGRALAEAAVLPLVIGALLSGGLIGWEMLTASQSVLDPGDYARLRVGQERSDVERFLPDRQINHRLRTVGPRGDGTTCEYYAMTSDRFNGRSGDAYRLCFRADRLVSLDALTP